MKDRMLLTLLHALPKKTISRWMGRFARSPVSKRFIPYYIKRFDINLSEVEKPWEEYESLMEFFVRRLKPGARPVDPSPDTVVSPVDGTISQLGTITRDTLIQAKGLDYRLEDLLGGDRERAKQFENGTFVTIYLSPRDYHRIHAPIKGRIQGLTYIPGTLFPVNTFGVRTVRGLFVRNERLITYLTSPALGTVAVIKVGATNVGSVKVTYDPEIVTNQPRQNQLEKKSYDPEPELEKGQELGRFEFGSTVILLFEKGKIQWCRDWRPEDPVQMGQPIAKAALRLQHTVK
ncbi:phosphatidylserine decarboxylase [Polycladomyces sp. WAk]|uniref:Phosphatidylserine decarboxylase proenzyme n=1 Tax=Polycladomyces zharkentensis TaxID=2807616 RepID=A0ABS2WGR1_9BACL|nr:archaetidylserine decarboxylase [Polycladomyces sp. WAk]MBN2908689.1 phosphatidylserine decarboxylase [Polycladomyces sp. WAk]